VRGFFGRERRLLKRTPKQPRLGRGIGIKVGVVVAFAAASATGGIKRLFSLAAWGDGDEDLV
jgi:hypothetical protein